MRLLLAEDEKALSRALVTILERSHYGVDAVYNGRDALDYLRCGEYDGVILDIMMPEMDGITVLKTILAGLGADITIKATRNAGYSLEKLP